MVVFLKGNKLQMDRVIRTIIIDDNANAVESLTNNLSSSSNIKVVSKFSNGEDALNFIINNNNGIDLIITETVLPKLDGIDLLEELKSRGIFKKIIILSNYKSEKILQNMSYYGVCQYIVKPYNYISLLKRINDEFNNKEKLIINNIDLEISNLLHNLGIPSHIRGFKYIREGILLIYKNKTISFITKEVYPYIAEKYDTTPSRVERAIRHAIEISFDRGDYKLMEELFGYSINSEKSRPTNSEFLATLADKLRMESCLN